MYVSGLLLDGSCRIISCICLTADLMGGLTGLKLPRMLMRDSQSVHSVIK
jgi:hypothetical protein